MKKIVLIILIIIVIIAAGTYLFYPVPTSISQTSVNDVSEANAARFLIRKHNWHRWWPGQSSKADSNLYSFNGVNYQLTESTNGGMLLTMSDGPVKFKSKMTYLAGDGLKVTITWTADLDSTQHPLSKITQFKAVSRVSENMTAILNRLKSFLADDRNVYQFNIHLEKVKDTIVLATSSTLKKYPDVTVIEPMIAKLQRLIKEQGALQTAPPMLNVNQLSKEEFEVMVAVPMNKQIQPKENTVINKLVPGNILVANVTGGINTVKNAFREIRDFSKDYHFTAPAMPFESLVTDRTAVKDTSKWKTNIYFPIF